VKMQTYVNFDGRCAKAFRFYSGRRHRFGINWMILHERPMNAPAQDAPV